MSSDTKTDTKTDATPPRDYDEDVVMTFPQRMMEILTDEANSGAVTWLPHGKGFIIYNKKKFAAEVLPRYFKVSKFTSFTRKLNRWGFVRVTQRGPEMGAYYHKFFQRDNPSLCLRMTCETTTKQSLKPQEVPMMSQAAMLQSSQLYPPMGNEAALIAQNNYLQQQLLLRIEHERTMSNLYMQMLQNKGTPGVNPLPMANPPMLNASHTALAGAQVSGSPQGSPESSDRSKKAKAA